MSDAKSEPQQDDATKSDTLNEFGAKVEKGGRTVTPRVQVENALAADYKRRVESATQQADKQRRELRDGITVSLAPLVAQRDRAVAQAQQVLRNTLSKLQNDMQKEMAAARDKILGEYTKRRNQANEVYEAVRQAEHKSVSDKLASAMQEMERQVAEIEGKLKADLARAKEWRDQERQRFDAREKERQAQEEHQAALAAHAAALQEAAQAEAG